jgi:uncharacterized protein (DUF2267 family)
VPFPFAYGVARQTFLDVLEAVREEAALSTTNQAFTVLEGVLRVFRRRIDVQDSLRFADTLPVALRALYVHDWDIAAERRPFDDPLHLAHEVRSLRRRHNSAPDSAVSDVARAVRPFVVTPDFDDLLGSLPAGARQFWSGQNGRH